MKIIKKYYTQDHERHHDFHVKMTDQIRERKIFTFLPLLINKKFG